MHDFVVLLGIMFGNVVGLVLVTWFPVYIELFVADAIFQPIKSHVEGFGSFLFDEGCGDIVGC